MYRVMMFVVFACAGHLFPETADADPGRWRTGGTAVGAKTHLLPPDPSVGLALRRLTFAYETGEHQVVRMGHLVGRGVAHNWFGDEAPEPYRYDAMHMPLDGAGTLTAQRTGCAGACPISIPAPPDGAVVVLTGFLFEIADGSAHPIQTLAVEPAQGPPRIEVELNDGRDVSYDATVQYTFVPEARVRDGEVRTIRRTVSGKRIRYDWPDLKGTSSPMLVQGFRVSFSDGPRPLQRFVVAAVTDHVGLWFHDAGLDDPFDVALHVVPTTY